jgi:hypothetical protein
MDESKEMLHTEGYILLSEHSQSYLLLSCLEDEMNGKVRFLYIKPAYCIHIMHVLLMISSLDTACHPSLTSVQAPGHEYLTCALSCVVDRSTTA